jgi:hypothetical protein
MKSAKPKSTPRSTKSRNARHPRVVDAVVQEGDLITFAPTGEKVRITKIERGQITFEKSP